MADGSAHTVVPGVTATFKAKGVAPDPTAWQWACTVRGALADAPPPNGW
jgi:hypothetical protein